MRTWCEHQSLPSLSQRRLGPRRRPPPGADQSQAVWECAAVHGPPNTPNLSPPPWLAHTLTPLPPCKAAVATRHDRGWGRCLSGAPLQRGKSRAGCGAAAGRGCVRSKSWRSAPKPARWPSPFTREGLRADKAHVRAGLLQTVRYRPSCQHRVRAACPASNFSNCVRPKGRPRRPSSHPRPRGFARGGALARLSSSCCPDAPGP